MKEERNVILASVYPYMQRFSAEYQLDFQLVDLRWGINDQCVNQHAVEKICMKEIKRCDEISAGSNILVRFIVYISRTFIVK